MLFRLSGRQPLVGSRPVSVFPSIWLCRQKKVIWVQADLFDTCDVVPAVKVTHRHRLKIFLMG